MRVLEALAVLAAAIPVVLSSAVHLPNGLCKPDVQRCHDNNVEECDLGSFELLQQCTESQFCIIDTMDPHARGQCLEQDCVQEPCLEKKETIDDLFPMPTKRSENLPGPELCQTVGEERCIVDNFSQQFSVVCGKDHIWTPKDTCSQPGSLMTPHCILLNGLAHCFGSPPPVPTPMPCHPAGKFRCAGTVKDSKFIHGIEECGADNSWAFTETCSSDEVCMHWQPKDDDLVQATCIWLENHPTLSFRSTNKFCPVVGKSRCGRDYAHGRGWVDHCGPDHQWGYIRDCPHDQMCMQDRENGIDTADCYWVKEKKPPASRSVPNGRAQCDTVGEQRCHGIHIQECVIEHAWVNKEVCDSNASCKEQDSHARCENNSTPPSAPQSIPEQCTPGDRTCGPSNYALYLCGADKTFYMEKKCLTLGDCKIDSPGHAHCERGGTAPPSTKRDDTQCTPGEYACDSNRRFVFTCNANHRWSDAHQCNRAGGCQAIESDETFPKGKLGCAGSPQYLYNDGRICETVASCELMRYMYCSAGEVHNPDVREHCRKTMCEDADCADCDRCTFKLGPGETIVPCMSTLFHGSPSPWNATDYSMVEAH
ncbi:hypothetical protein EJ02DRAFT_456393 [Clathrospora elynae]|uniref:Uncharacterized protein n=1 Tax=Clathrospora elynae TaxID=706981 RepID=A0A6A5SK70_9PLEO|nr:hypothetical protein EJ02DRAFT_456393 [Clathrospora elynae]